MNDRTPWDRRAAKRVSALLVVAAAVGFARFQLRTSGSERSRPPKPTIALYVGVASRAVQVPRHLYEVDESDAEVVRVRTAPNLFEWANARTEFAALSVDRAVLVCWDFGFSVFGVVLTSAVDRPIDVKRLPESSLRRIRLRFDRGAHGAASSPWGGIGSIPVSITTESRFDSPVEAGWYSAIVRSRSLRLDGRYELVLLAGAWVDSRAFAPLSSFMSRDKADCGSNVDFVDLNPKWLRGLDVSIRPVAPPQGPCFVSVSRSDGAFVTDFKLDDASELSTTAMRLPIEAKEVATGNVWIDVTAAARRWSGRIEVGPGGRLISRPKPTPPRTSNSPFRPGMPDGAAGLLPYEPGFITGNPWAYFPSVREVEIVDGVVVDWDPAESLRYRLVRRPDPPMSEAVVDVGFEGVVLEMKDDLLCGAATGAVLSPDVRVDWLRWTPRMSTSQLSAYFDLNLYGASALVYCGDGRFFTGALPEGEWRVVAMVKDDTRDYRDIPVGLVSIVRDSVSECEVTIDPGGVGAAIKVRPKAVEGEAPR